MCQQHCISTFPARRPLLLFLHRRPWFRRGVEGLQTWSSADAGERGMPVNELKAVERATVGVRQFRCLRAPERQMRWLCPKQNLLEETIKKFTL